MLKNLYNALATRLDNIHENGSPKFKQIELWNNQWQYEKEITPLEFPCCFIEFVQLPMEQYGNKVQQGTAVIRLHIGSKSVTENKFGRPNHDKYNEHLDLVDVVNFWMSGFNGENFSSLKRTLIEVDHNHDQLIAHAITYHSRVNDYSAVHPTVHVRGDILEVNISGMDFPIAIGKYFQGGKVFSLDATGEHGLICYPIPLSEAMNWATTPCSTGALTSDGEENTAAIIQALPEDENYAALACNNFTNAGYDNWYLPAKQELDWIYLRLLNEGITNIPTGQYWSSNEDSETDAVYFDFTDGSWGTAAKTVLKKVLAVRTF